MLDFSKLLFLLLCIFILIYLIYIFKTKKRFPILVEVSYIGFYGFIILYTFFYSFFQTIFKKIGISNPSLFFVYIAICLIFLIFLMLYRKTEEQRVEITKLVSEIAIINKKLNDKKK